MLAPDSHARRSLPAILSITLMMNFGLLANACSGNEIQVVDAHYSTPEHTIESLLTSYGLQDSSQEQVRASIAEHGAFELVDRPLFEGCFADLESRGGEGMAGYVLGMIAAAKDELRFETVGERATVYPREGVAVVMALEDGAYRIVLSESVPEQVRRGLLQVEQRAPERQRVDPAAAH